MNKDDPKASELNKDVETELPDPDGSKQEINEKEAWIEVYHNNKILVVLGVIGWIAWVISLIIPHL